MTEGTLGYKCVIVLKDGQILKDEKDLLMEAIAWIKMQVGLSGIRNIDTILITDVK